MYQSISTASINDICLYSIIRGRERHYKVKVEECDSARKLGDGHEVKKILFCLS